MEEMMQKYLELLKIQAKTKEINKKIKIAKDELENLNSKRYKLVREIEELEEKFVEKILQEPLN